MITAAYMAAKYHFQPEFIGSEQIQPIDAPDCVCAGSWERVAYQFHEGYAPLPSVIGRCDFNRGNGESRMNPIDNSPMFEALDSAATEVRIGLELAKEAQASRSDSDDLALCSLHHIEMHLLNAQAALQAAGAR